MSRRLRRLKKIFAGIYVYLILLLMYLPILVLIVFSFNSATSISEGGSWDLSLYRTLFSSQSEEIWIALGNTVLIALISASVSTVLGTMGAIGVFAAKRRTRRVIEAIGQIPVANAEIVMALSLTVMFVFLGKHVFGDVNIFGFYTLLIGHVVLSLPFVYLSVRPKLQQMDPSLYEAALDLGAKPSLAYRKVVLPQLLPGIIAGFLLAVTLSLDDFIITAFTRGAGLLSGERNIETLSTLVQAKIKKGPVPPAMRPLTLIIFLIVLAIVLFLSIRQNRKAGALRKKRRQRNA